MEELLILDKDLTIVKPVSDSGFVQHPEDQKLMPGVADKLIRHFRNSHNQCSMAILSNQGGVERGYKTLDDAIAEMEYCLQLIVDAVSQELVKNADGLLSAYFCPDMNGVDCYSVGLNYGCRKVDFLLPRETNYRKPGTGMIEVAIAEYEICNYEKSGNLYIMMVGDRPEDQQAAQDAGVYFMWADDWRKSK